MFFKQFFHPGLGHASYLIGSEQTGEALVFDPRRDVDDYFAEARRQGFQIRYGADSHGHNDYLSGLTELVARGEVELMGTSEADLGYSHRPLREGDRFDLGEVGIEVLHTPGHTPEHISLLLYDKDASEQVPALLLSGGALLVGDLARPDLLGGREQAEQSAKAFCSTIQTKLLTLPDHVEVFPTHVSGSLCGGNIGSRLSTTVGYERMTNAILSQVDSEAGFVAECLRLDNLPAVPPYWARMRAQNLAGVSPLGTIGEPPALAPEQFVQAVTAGATVVDTRSPEAFGGGHIPGALNVGLGPSFATWAGTVLPADAAVLVVLDWPEHLASVTWELLRIGYDRPIGWLAGGLLAWRTEGRPLGRLPQITVHELKARLDDRQLRLVDVRQPAEWAAGHVPGAQFVTGAELPRRLDEVSGGQEPLAVMCGSGFRSSVAGSVLAAHGHDQVVNVLGGMAAWKAANYPVTSED